MLAIAFLFKKKVAKLPVVSWFVSVSLRWPEPDRAHAWHPGWALQQRHQN